MKNITVTVADDVYRRARILAAEQGTTVSGIVKATLHRLTAKETAAEERKRRLQELFDKVDAEISTGPPPPPPEPGWRDRLYDERFDNSVLGRELKQREP